MVRVPGSAGAGAGVTVGVVVGAASGVVEDEGDGRVDAAALDVEGGGSVAGASIASALPRQAAVSSTERAAAVVPSARMRGSLGGCL
jgi:hypothetical protein